MRHFNRFYGKGKISRGFELVRNGPKVGVPNGEYPTGDWTSDVQPGPPCGCGIGHTDDANAHRTKQNSQSPQYLARAYANESRHS